MAIFMDFPEPRQVTERSLKGMADVLDAIYDAAYKPSSEHAKQASLSICAEATAQNLADAAALMADAEPRALRELIPVEAAKFRQKAERVIVNLDPVRVQGGITSAVDATCTYFDTHPAGYLQQPSVEDIARHAIETYLAQQAQPVGRLG